jgi:PadR family transcriptional regulator, regulatory protein AphA
MNARTLCLSILYEGEATGYEIRKLSVEGECSYFVEASYGSIYPALQKLEAEKLVTSRVEQQDGKPAKKIYAITEAGRQAFISSLFEKLGEDEFRSEFLLFARFASELPASLVEQRLRERVEMIDAQLAEIDKLAAQHSHPADAWVISYGRECLGIAREYIRSHMHELIALARPDTGTAAAAE